jgi:hypothetical protein
MKWQTAVPNASEINSSAAHLLDALELVRPLGDSDSRLSPSMLGRWIMESGEDGTIAEDTVVWLHHLLLPDARPSALRREYRMLAVSTPHQLAA